MTPLQTPAAVVAELERLEGAMTPGPWHRGSPADNEEDFIWGWCNGTRYRVLCGDMDDADRDGIVAVRGVLPALIADAKRARELVAVVEAARDTLVSVWSDAEPDFRAYYTEIPRVIKSLQTALDAAKDKEDGK